MQLQVETKPRNTERATRTYLLQTGAAENCHNSKSSYGFSTFTSAASTLKRNNNNDNNKSYACLSYWLSCLLRAVSGVQLWLNTSEITRAAPWSLSALSCSAALCNLVSARGLHMILTPRSARLVPRELTRAPPLLPPLPPSTRFEEALACVGKCGSVSVQTRQFTQRGNY